MALSRNERRELHNFEGTSAAAPLVSGIVSDMMLFLPDANVEKIEQIIKKTAIPTFINNAGSVNNGAGLLNGYKAIRVAQNVKRNVFDAGYISGICETPPLV